LRGFVGVAWLIITRNPVSRIAYYSLINMQLLPGDVLYLEYSAGPNREAN